MDPCSLESFCPWALHGCLLQGNLCLQRLAFPEQSIAIFLQSCKCRAQARGRVRCACPVLPRPAQGHDALSRPSAKEACLIFGRVFFGGSTWRIPFPVLFSHHDAVEEWASLQVPFSKLGILCNDVFAELDGIGKDIARSSERSQSHQQGQAQHGVPQGVSRLDRQMLRQGNPYSPQHSQPCHGRGKEPFGLSRGDEYKETEPHAVQREGPRHSGCDSSGCHDGEEGLVQRSRGPLFERMADFEGVVQDTADEQPHGEGQPLPSTPVGLEVPERPRSFPPAFLSSPPRRVCVSFVSFHPFLRFSFSGKRPFGSFRLAVEPRRVSYVAVVRGVSRNADLHFVSSRKGWIVSFRVVSEPSHRPFEPTPVSHVLEGCLAYPSTGSIPNRMHPNRRRQRKDGAIHTDRRTNEPPNTQRMDKRTRR